MNTCAAHRQGAGSQRPLYGGVLVGGASTRMGRPKALLAFGKTTIVEHVVGVVQARVDCTVLLGDAPLPAALQSFRRLPDVPDLAGPFAGMLAAMRWARDVDWLVVACDLPLLRPEALDWLLAQRGPGRAAVLPTVVPGRAEPLLAVYEPQALELLEQLVARGFRSPRRLAGDSAVYTPTPPLSLRECWTNVNTTLDYRRLASVPDCSYRKAHPSVGG